jgi:hypothetical protein
MEKDLASLHISNKAAATLGAQALNSALHDDTSFLTWADLSTPEHGRVSRVNCRSIASRITLGRLLDLALTGCSSSGPACSLSMCGAGAPPSPANAGTLGVRAEGPHAATAVIKSRSLTRLDSPGLSRVLGRCSFRSASAYVT